MIQTYGDQRRVRQLDPDAGRTTLVGHLRSLGA